MLDVRRDGASRCGDRQRLDDGSGRGAELHDLGGVPAAAAGWSRRSGNRSCSACRAASAPTEAGVVLADHARRVTRQLGRGRGRPGPSGRAASRTAHDRHLPERGRIPPGPRGQPLPYHTPGRAVHRPIRPTGAADVEMLDSGEVDLSLLWDYAWNQVDPDAYTLTHLLDDPTMLVVSADHPLADRKHVAMADLATEEWVVREPSITRSPRCSTGAVAQPASNRRSHCTPTTIRRLRRWSASASASPWRPRPPSQTPTPTSA